MGAQAFTKALDLPLQLYAPYFCMDTPYAETWDMLSSNTSRAGCDGYAFKTPAPANAEKVGRRCRGIAWGALAVQRQM